MRSPSDMPIPTRVGRLSRRFWLGVGVLVVALLFMSLRSLATLWTDQMWFSSQGFSSVFSTLLSVKATLVVLFGTIFALALFVNLWVAQRCGAKDLGASPEDEMIRRFQHLVQPYARRIYALISVVLGFIAGINTIGQWQNFLLFMHGHSFHRVDPVFHKDISFYVFTLPFVHFVITWAVVATIFQIVITTVASYLHGGIRSGAGVLPRVAPSVQAHLSLLGALVALEKAAGYVVARYELVNSSNGYVQGAGYTDIHARMPAMTILIFLSIAAALLFVANVRLRRWSLPAVALGLWAFVSLIIGVAYPAVLQALKVSPNQNSLESPYIARNIAATRAAYNVDSVNYLNFSGASTVTSAQVQQDQATLNNIRLWDPDPSIALVSVNKRQSIRSYYQFTSLGVDRYVVNGKVTPVLIGARQLNASALPASGWVNTHLQYTHGVGAAVVLANTADPSTGNPVFGVSNVPPVSTSGLPAITQPGVYFGLNDPGWVVANTKQPELDYQVTTGASAGQLVETHYAGSGGVKVGNIFRRAAFALRLGDFNFLISNQITNNSRVLFVRDVVAMAQKAAPFLNFDSSPYAVLANGHIDFVLDGYTSTDQYPYSENATNLNINQGGLPNSFNYIRNSVKVVIDAYSGKMTFYTMDSHDPILATYAAAFPGMFHPYSQMPVAIQTHLHYPADLFGAQAAVLGRYHITNAAAFYDASDQWEVSPTTGAGSPSQTIEQSVSTDASGNIVAVSNTPMTPNLTVGALPNESNQQLLETLEFVPAGNSSTVQGLSAFMVATSSPSDYGHLSVYVTPRGQTVTGPVQADAEIQQNATVSETTSLLDQHGSSVLLGNNIMVPLDNSVLYMRPMYTTSTANPLPQLRYVVAVFNQQVGLATTLDGALAQVLGTSVTTSSTTSSSSSSSSTPTSGKSASYYLSQASSEYAAAQTALTSGNLAQYQADIESMDNNLVAAQHALSNAKG